MSGIAVILARRVGGSIDPSAQVEDVDMPLRSVLERKVPPSQESELRLQVLRAQSRDYAIGALVGIVGTSLAIAMAAAWASRSGGRPSRRSCWASGRCYAGASC